MLDSLLTLNANLNAKSKLPPPFYKERSVEWILKVDDSGFALVATDDRMNLPDRSRSGRASRPRFVDTAEYLLGLPEPGKQKRAQRHHGNYLDMIGQAADGLDEPKVTTYHEWQKAIGVAVVPSVEGDEPLPESLSVRIGGAEQEVNINELPEDATSGDRFLLFAPEGNVLDAYELSSDMDRSDRVVVTVGRDLLHEMDTVQDWWASFMDDTKSEKITEEGPCSICGTHRPIARLHTGIRRFNSAIASYNEDAFESYGKTQSYNAWTCQVCERKIARTLSWLFDSDDHSYYFNDTNWVWWTEEPVPSFSLNPLQDGDTNKILDLLASYHNGTLMGNDTPLWMLAIEENQGRLMVRHFERATVGRIETKLAQYFDAMRIGDQFFGAGALLMSLIEVGSGSRSFRDIPPWMEAGLMSTALTGQALPYPFLLAALNRTTALGSVSAPRAALLKLYLITNGHPMTPALNPDHPNIAYQLGRLFATLQSVQYKALNSPNSTIADRFFKSASTTPQGIFGTLLSKSQAHLSKIRKSDGSAHVAFQQQIGEIMGHIEDFPATLSPQDQALFSLGYYHQRQHTFARIEAAKQKASDEGDADEAPVEADTPPQGELPL